MVLDEMIYKLRTDAKMSQEDFAKLFDVSRQAVQKWENGTSVPELSKIVEISKHFDISLDALVMKHDNRVVEESKGSKELKPKYQNIHSWEFYTSAILTEYKQSVEEGLDIESYKELFEAVSRLPKDEIKNKLGEIVFEIVINAKQKENYKYIEPSELGEIRALRKLYPVDGKVDETLLGSKIHGAWVGRICGCMHGKPIEGIRINDPLASLLVVSGQDGVQVDDERD